MENKFPKVGVYIDGANIFHGSRKAGWVIDYEKLSLFIKKKFNPVTISYFNCTGYELDESGRRKRGSDGEFILQKSQVRFHNKLQGMGMRIYTKPLKFVLGNKDAAKNKMDSEIVLTAFKESSLWDELFLFTGDCDFESLVNEITSQGKRVHIFSFKSHIAYELKTKALASPLVDYTPIDNLRSILEKDPQR